MTHLSIKNIMPKSKKQNEEIIEIRCETILHSALVLFSLFGYQSIGMDQIAKDSKCSRALVYHYFPSKEELFGELMKKVAGSIFQLTESVNYGNKAKESLTELIDKLLSEIKNSDDHDYMSCVIYLLLNLHLQKDYIPKPRHRDEVRPLGRKRLFEIVYYLIEKGQVEGDFNEGNPKEYTIAILSLIKGLAYNKIYLKNKFCCPSTSIIMNMVNKKEQIYVEQN